MVGECWARCRGWLVGGIMKPYEHVNRWDEWPAHENRSQGNHGKCWFVGLATIHLLGIRWYRLTWSETTEWMQWLICLLAGGRIYFTFNKFIPRKDPFQHFPQILCVFSWSPSSLRFHFKQTFTTGIIPCARDFIVQYNFGRGVGIQFDPSVNLDWTDQQSAQEEWVSLLLVQHTNSVWVFQ